MDALDREFNEMCDRLAPPGSKPSFPPVSAYAPSSPVGTTAPAVFSPGEEARLREEFTRQLLGGLSVTPPHMTERCRAQLAAIQAAAAMAQNPPRESPSSIWGRTGAPPAGWSPS